jgi:hypothetical protein
VLPNEQYALMHFTIVRRGGLRAFVGEVVEVADALRRTKVEDFHVFLKGRRKKACGLVLDDSPESLG